MKAYTEKSPRELPYVAFYPDDLEMVEDARRVFNEKTKAGMKPIIIAHTGRWTDIEKFEQAYGALLKTIHFRS